MNVHVHANSAIPYRLSVSLAEAHSEGQPHFSYNSKVYHSTIITVSCLFFSNTGISIHFIVYCISLPLCSRLLSPAPDTVLRSCQFIHDVLLEDFPAEIFLQRSAVFKVSLQTVCSSNDEFFVYMYEYLMLGDGMLLVHYTFCTV